MTTISRKTTMAAAIALASIGLLTAQGAGAGEFAGGPHLFGDWNGERTALEKKGVAFNAGYTSEIAGNSAGGSAEKIRYSDQWVLGTDLDLGKLWGWNGAAVNLTVTNRNGKNLSDDARLGTFQQVQEVYGRGQTWRLTNLSMTQSLFDGRLLLKAGRLNVGSDFAGFSCDFQNLTFCGSQPGNIVGSYWANWPVSVWAGVARLRTSAQSYVKLGLYQVNPQYLDDAYNVRKGLHPNNPHGTSGALVPLELGYTAAVKGLPGSYQAGLWYNTSDSADLMLDRERRPLGSTTLGALVRDGAYGGYVNLRQQVSGVAGGSGASLFLNASQADKFTAATDSQVAAGVEYQGVFGRAADMIGAAVGATHGNGRHARYQRTWNSAHPEARTVVNDGYEVAAEVFYSWSPLPSVSIRPNLQLVKHPGGSARNGDAVVFGVKSSVAF